MKRRWAVVASLWMVSILGQGLYGQATERKLFETKMYSIEEISHFGVSDEKFAALSDAQKRSLIEARSDLMDMLQAIQHRRDVTKYATPATVRKYKTSSALAASMIEAETSILAAGVSDFSYVDEGTIKLNFFAVVSSEGNIVVSEKTAVLKQVDSAWRFAGLE
jgi:hypothetical protein